MAGSEPIVTLCRRWLADAPLNVAEMKTGGFSGSRVALVERQDTGERFVLKCFHDAATEEHARFVHGLARHLRDEGVGLVAGVIRSIDGDTIVVDAAGRIWELCRFISGNALPRPLPQQAGVAASTLARLHVVAARHPSFRPASGPSRAIVERISRAHALLASPWRGRLPDWFRAARESINEPLKTCLEARAIKAIDTFDACGGGAFLARLAGFQPPECILQPVLRDVWHEHVLFTWDEDQVAGIIDLHAAAIDTPAADLARLFGSWGDSAGSIGMSLFDRWPRAFHEYRAVRPMPAVEARLIPVLHAGTVVFGLDNWFRWTFEERRVFSCVEGILARIDDLLDAMPAALATAWYPPGNVD